MIIIITITTVTTIITIILTTAQDWGGPARTVATASRPTPATASRPTSLKIVVQSAVIEDAGTGVEIAGSTGTGGEAVSLEDFDMLSVLGKGGFGKVLHSRGPFNCPLCGLYAAFLRHFGLPLPFFLRPFY